MRQKKYDSILMVVEWLTKSTHFIPVKCTYSAEYYSRIFIDEIVCRHCFALSIISYRSAQSTSRFWRSFQQGSGRRLS